MTNKTLAAALVAIALAPAFAEAKPVVKNLGGGLAEIASSEGRAKSLSADAKHPGSSRGVPASPSCPIRSYSTMPAARWCAFRSTARRRGTALQDLRAIAGVEVVASDRLIARAHRSVCARRTSLERRAHEGCARGRALEPDGHQRRRHRQPGHRAAPREQTSRGRRWLRHHGGRDVRQL